MGLSVPWIGFFVLFGCTEQPMSENPAVNTTSTQLEMPSENALKTINFMHMNNIYQEPIQQLYVWSEKPSELSTLLPSVLKDAELVQDIHSTGVSTLWLIHLNAGERLPNIPTQNRVVAILSGTWSQQDLYPISRRTEGYVVVDSSASRFVNPAKASDLDNALATVSELKSHYTLSVMPQLDAAQSTVHPALWYLANSDWIDSAHPDPRVRVHAVQNESDPLLTLQQVTLYPEQVNIDTLATHSEPWIQAQALRHVSSLQTLANGLQSGSSLVRLVSLNRLSDRMRVQSNEYGCHLLKHSSKSPHAYERWKAAYGLGFCTATSELMELFDDDDIDVVRQAVLSFSNQKTAPQYLPQLLKLTGHSNSFVRRWTWKTIAGLEGVDVTSALQSCLDNEPSVLAKEECARGLHRKGIQTAVSRYVPPDFRRIGDLEEAVAHPDPTYRKDLAKFLSNSPSGVSLLKTLARDGDGEVRKSAVEALGYAHDSTVWDAISDSDPDVVVTALVSIAIGAIDGDCETLIPLLHHSDVEIQLRATEAMSALNIVKAVSPRCVSQLTSLSNHADERVRAAVLTSTPQFVRPTEQSLLVQYSIAGKIQHQSTDLMLQWALDDDKKYWVSGIVELQDDLCHEIFSWNDPSNKPMTHKGIRPPLFRTYGQPNRG